MVSVAFTNTLVQSFASKPFIQQALLNAYHPFSVINFWFGIDTTTDSGRHQLQYGSKECITDMAPLWYSGGTDFDTLCQPFIDVIHLAGTKSLPSEVTNPDSSNNNNNEGTTGSNVWYNTVEGNVAQVILIDQIARNVFRGTENAFKYDSISLTIARQLSSQYLLQVHQEQKDANTEFTPALNLGLISSALQQPFDSEPLHLVDNVHDKMMYPTFSTVIATSLMHSEQPSDHQLCQALLQHSIALTKQRRVDDTTTATITSDDDGNTATNTANNDVVLRDWFQYQLQFAMDHATIIHRFGRYPHRNQLLNRTSTDDENQWLNDVEHLPLWAKSQEQTLEK